MAVTAAERGRDVRRRLLTAAAELIPEVGWNSVSTRLLAQRAGVAPGLVHYHFPSLAVLLREAAVGVMREVVLATAPGLATAETVDAGLDLMLASLDAYTGTDPTSLLFIETYLAATRDENLRTELAGLVEEFRDALRSWLAEHGQDDHHQVAAVLAAAIDGVMLHRALHPELTSPAVFPVLRRMLAPGTANR
ncbi:MAG: TetR family transcriptional regulator [Pseudonocardiaceae bacterium]|nr:TetR family transcriptional regulator [Pseudonocardiaceae bacterium]